MDPERDWHTSNSTLQGMLSALLPTMQARDCAITARTQLRCTRLSGEADAPSTTFLALWQRRMSTRKLKRPLSPPVKLAQRWLASSAEHRQPTRVALKMICDPRTSGSVLNSVLGSRLYAARTLRLTAQLVRARPRGSADPMLQQS